MHLAYKVKQMSTMRLYTRTLKTHIHIKDDDNYHDEVDVVNSKTFDRQILHRIASFLVHGFLPLMSCY